MSPHSKIISKDIKNLVITNVEVWNEEGRQSHVDVISISGIITEIRPHVPGRQIEGVVTIDGAGLVLIPAGVDAQVHLRVPGQEQKETATSGLWAAVAGGVGAILTMPNTKPVLDDVSVLDMARREVAAAGSATNVRVLFSAAMTMGQRGRECVDFDGLARAGVAAFTDDGVGVADDQVMRQVIAGASRTGLPILQHAEIPGHGGVLAEGRAQKDIGGPAYPSAAESDMVKRDLEILKDFPAARYHVLHVSATSTLELVRYGKNSGLNVTCEVSPHHLFFCADDVVFDNTSFKMNPPLRSKDDQTRLRLALADGTCDFMATDHAPHESAVKTTNFKTSAFGTTGLETSLRVLLDMWNKGEISERRLVEVWASKPARFLGIHNEYGSIRVGMPLRAVLCDPRATSRVVMTNDFVGLSKNSCFIGAKLPGALRATILDQKVHQLA